MILDGKTAIVTGRGPGDRERRGRSFVKAGARVLIVDREALGGEAEIELRAGGGDLVFMPFDLSRHAELDQIVPAAMARFGQLDILVNVAQVAELAPIADLSERAMRLPFDTGFWPTFLLMRAAHPHLVKTRGCVINFATGATLDALAGHSAYATAKEAIRSVSRIAAN